jgi:hypothetical protein
MVLGNRITPFRSANCKLLTANFSQDLERVAGIEPAWPAWKAGTLPLSYTRIAVERQLYRKALGQLEPSRNNSM